MKVTNKEDKAILFTPAGLFIGLGIGFLTDQIVGGVITGLGFGFLLTAILKFFSK